MIYKIKTALISVSDKTNLIEFAKFLVKNNIKIISTGGTAGLLLDNKIKVKEVSEHTNFSQMMAGRVKTLHPKIHGGILGRDGIDDDIMHKHGIEKIDLVIVNLYPFADTIAKKDCTLDMAIENIDIGGPAMVRSAAKNFQRVAVVTNPTDYSTIEDAIQEKGGTDLLQRQLLSAKAFSHTAKYDGLVSNYLTSLDNNNKTLQFPRVLNMQYNLKQNVRYGENPHQNGAFYVLDNITQPCISNACQLHGKDLSYNNIADTDAALQCIRQFDEPTCVIVKHANPCGVASSSNITQAYDKAYATDPESSFGGIIAFNQALDKTTAENIIARQFVEVIIAPGITEDAIKIISTKKNIRLLSIENLNHSQKCLDFKKVNGGLLVQDSDDLLYDNLKVVSKIHPTKEQLDDLIFVWKVAKFVKSNAIVYGKNKQTIGIGAGQMSRINSARIATSKAVAANLEVAGSYMASDAFFPFRDGIDEAAKNHIKAVIQPGGSIRDDEVILAADNHKMIMVFTNTRHFRH
ncbi:MAG: bifunctional phosphoribosylaminoimidazolecarboxamide formyltransferase/inosine monophosphate cyclohydrolase [Gammaproteobacteria bacterium]|nr:MAG: bifunctional phosphoribosylaminoimidazolecarboxamide formyltransferase/inosine monophosphate cyclohydrolase [Gammaproteobacteria bacterium]